MLAAESRSAVARFGAQSSVSDCPEIQAGLARYQTWLIPLPHILEHCYHLLELFLDLILAEIWQESKFSDLVYWTAFQ